ncbi:UNVERIFIED_CONTAM: hypothetical protein Sangu_1679100 [Sesamum angustifolium]|uniref:Uncharacterized protein n=1 Tax=Sesamum angustifolium TaxID=2727405 RepID=A0AAW2MJJ4_9LAMI
MLGETPKLSTLKTLVHRRRQTGPFPPRHPSPLPINSPHHTHRGRISMEDPGHIRGQDASSASPTRTITPHLGSLPHILSLDTRLKVTIALTRKSLPINSPRLPLAPNPVRSHT